MIPRAVLLACLVSVAPADPPAKARAQVPLLRPGEELTYTVQSTRLGPLGKATFRVTGPDTVAGVSAFMLSFDFSGKVVLFKITDQTRSWLRTDSLSMFRYSKRERSPVGRRDEDVRVDPVLGQWADGKVRAPLASERPLDELSFLYLLRSLDLEPAQTIEIRRHFDVRRNPVRVEAELREAVDGVDCLVYVMRVPDPRQKKGTSSLRFFITNDEARLPLRIESTMPVAGDVVMTLESAQLLPRTAAR